MAARDRFRDAFTVSFKIKAADGVPSTWLERNRVKAPQAKILRAGATCTLDMHGHHRVNVIAPTSGGKDSAITLITMNIDRLGQQWAVLMRFCTVTAKSCAPSRRYAQHASIGKRTYSRLCSPE